MGPTSYERKGAYHYSKLKKLNLHYSLDAIYGMVKKEIKNLLGMFGWLGGLVEGKFVSIFSLEKIRGEKASE